MVALRAEVAAPGPAQAGAGGVGAGGLGLAVIAGTQWLSLPEDQKNDILRSPVLWGAGLGLGAGLLLVEIGASYLGAGLEKGVHTMAPYVAPTDGGAVLGVAARF